MTFATVDTENPQPQSLGITNPFKHTKDRMRRSLDDQSVYQGNAIRFRLTPGGMHQPLTVGVVCFLAILAIAAGLLEAGQRIGGWWHLSIPVKAMISLALAIPAGIFDFFYTKRGHERGRWDLIVDRSSGEIQTPAISAYGEPQTLRIEEVVRLESQTVIAPDESEGDRGTYRLNVICRHTHKNEAVQFECAKATAYTVAQSDSEHRIVALGEWLNDSAHLGLPVERSKFSGSFRQKISALSSASRQVDLRLSDG